MDKYPLQSLIGIRDRRFQDALAQQREMQRLLTLALETLDALKKELADYKIWKIEETARRYDEIMLQVKTQKELNEFNEGLAQLDVREATLHEKVVLQEEAVRKAKEDLDNAIKKANELHKGVMKLETHKDLWLIEQKKIAEYKIDQELEDFKGIKKVEFGSD